MTPKERAVARELCDNERVSLLSKGYLNNALAEIDWLKSVVDAAIARECDCLLAPNPPGRGEPCEHDRAWWAKREEYKSKEW